VVVELEEIITEEFDIVDEVVVELGRKTAKTPEQA